MNNLFFAIGVMLSGVAVWCCGSVILMFALRIDSIDVYQTINGGWEVSIKKGGKTQ